MPAGKLHAIALLCMLAASPASSADDYPAKPIRLIAGAAAGGGLDITARRIAPRFNETLKQPIIVENRPGAGGRIAAEFVARSQPDGYTVLIATLSELSIYASLGGALRYDPDKDFIPVAITSIAFPVLFVNPSLGIRNIAELVARAQANPEELTCGTSGPGTMDELACAWLAKRAGIRIRAVSYKGSAPAALDAAAGVVSMTANYLSVVGKQYVEPGKLIPLAVLAPDRMAMLPDTPTIAEAGYPGIDVTTWVAMMVPAGTPTDVVTRLSTETLKAMRDPVIAEAVRTTGSVSPEWTPAQAASFIRRDRDKWKRVSQETGIRIEQ